MHTWYIASRDVAPLEQTASVANVRPPRAISRINNLRMGRQVKRARVAVGMTQHELGTLSNVGVNTLQRIEIGKEDILTSQLSRLERVLNTSLRIS